MRTFTCLITDDRYSVPQLSFVVAADEQCARVLVHRELTASRHHLAVEVLEAGRLLFTEEARPR
jgi:hypothetical protein